MRAKLLGDLLSAVHETAAAATVAARYHECRAAAARFEHARRRRSCSTRSCARHRSIALVTKLARGLLDARKHGRWMSTQENLVVLQAMRRYFDIYEKDTPNYTGKLWFGSAAYAEQAFVGRIERARRSAQLDWSTLAPGSTHDIALTKTGPGRMYYRDRHHVRAEADESAAARRRLHRASQLRGRRRSGDVVQAARRPLEDQARRARARARSRRLNTTRRYAVALVDPLPAGFEPVNTNLATCRARRAR